MKFVHTFLLAIICSLFYSCQEDGQFRLLHSKETGVKFTNAITETAIYNILEYEYVYNGGGVAISDFNNDGLSDLYFTGNMVSNQLYLNKGGMEFEEITEIAGVGAPDKWCSGVSIIDINMDGWKDLYICATTYPEGAKRENILYINMGSNENQIPVFKDMAVDYGVNDSSHTTQAAFIDYDNDGDMDLFLATNKMEENNNPNVYRDPTNSRPESVDKLYRNDWDDKRGHPVFTDISDQAGIKYEGYSLGVNISDINQDGWSDIYVTNDYLSQDLVYINNQDGTFTNKSKSYFQHTSYSAMGNDIVDMNNDGLPDIVAVDMLPEDNFRKKTMMMSNNYTSYINNDKYGYQYQQVRNTFQVNQGFNPETGEPVFGDLAFMSGISSTDWSWAPMIADFDQNGLRDIIITNGFPKDVTDRDFMDYHSEVGQFTSKEKLLEKIPSVKIRNYAYKNIGKNTFEEVTGDWGIKHPSFSNGAAYGDLDNDGDLDYVVNNINDPAFVFENLTNNRESNSNNWLKINLKGDTKNPAGIGSKIYIYYGDQQAYWEQTPYRGYLSCMDEAVHFGLGEALMVDSLRIIWPLGKTQTLYDLPVNQHMSLEISTAKETRNLIGENGISNRLFTSLASKTFDDYVHEEIDFIDFNIQPLLLHKLSQYGPGIAIGDINGDELDDIYVSGATFKKGKFLIQSADGSFEKQDLLPGIEGNDKKEEELGSLLFDSDGDGDLDLYLVSGSAEFPSGDSAYQDRLFENRNGTFVLNEKALPESYLSGSCVRAADYDRDGDLDLFIGGRVYPHEYPKPVSSIVLRNESKPGQISFVIDEEISAPLKEIGMVSDALWTDFDNDGWVDLLMVGEWMPLTFMKNDGGSFKNITSSSGIGDKTGWWNSVVSGDFDNDGDIDYLAGNHGANTINKASEKFPVCIYGADFDNNKGFDIIPTVYLKDSEGQLKEFPFFGRGDILKQMIKLKGKFRYHSEYGQATIENVLTKEQISGALIYRANYMYTSYIENKGNGVFGLRALPSACQVAPVFGMLSGDFNQDGNLDVVMVGNDYSTEVSQGRFDAFKGQYLEGLGNGEFNLHPIKESGFYVPGDAKGLTYLLNENGEFLVIATQNRERLKTFLLPTDKMKVVALEPNDFLLEVELSGGKKTRREAYYGHSFLSQSSRRVLVPRDAVSVRITDYSGQSRTLSD